MRFSFIILLIAGFLSGQPLFGQSADSIVQEGVGATVSPSTQKISVSSVVSPKRIGLYSAVLPGLGQAVNRQYWKIPIIYAGAAVAAYYIYDNRKNYNDFRSVYIGRISNNPEAFKQHAELTSINQVEDAMNYYRHYLDLSVVISVAGYALQIMDAVVFANLKGFDISPDISLRVRPVIYNTGGAGLGLVMNFK